MILFNPVEFAVVACFAAAPVEADGPVVMGMVVVVVVAVDEADEVEEDDDEEELFEATVMPLSGEPALFTGAAPPSRRS